MRNLLLYTAWRFIFKFDKDGVIMMAMFFAQRVILGKATFYEEEVVPGQVQLIPEKLRKSVAEILMESGLDDLVPDQYKQ